MTSARDLQKANTLIKTGAISSLTRMLEENVSEDGKYLDGDLCSRTVTSISYLYGCCWQPEMLGEFGMVVPVIGKVLCCLAGYVRVKDWCRFESLFQLVLELSSSPEGRRALLEAKIILPSLSILMFHFPRHCTRIFSAFAASSVEEAKAVIDAGALISFSQYLTQQETSVDQITYSAILFTVSNITLDLVQTESVRASGLFSLLAGLMENESLVVAREASWAVCNVIQHGVSDHMSELITNGCIRGFFSFFTLALSSYGANGFQPEVAVRCLESIERLVKFDGTKTVNGVAAKCVYVPKKGIKVIAPEVNALQYQDVGTLVELTRHNRHEVASLAYKLLLRVERYIQVE